MEGVNKVLGNTLMLCLINAVVFGGLTFIFLNAILRFFGASGETLPYARDFMQVILLGTPITFTMIGLNHVMRATGHPKKAMLTSLTTVVCNIILAPIFISSSVGAYGARLWPRSFRNSSECCGYSTTFSSVPTPSACDMVSSAWSGASWAVSSPSACRRS